MHLDVLSAVRGCARDARGQRSLRSRRTPFPECGARPSFWSSDGHNRPIRPFSGCDEFASFGKDFGESVGEAGEATAGRPFRQTAAEHFQHMLGREQGIDHATEASSKGGGWAASAGERDAEVWIAPDQTRAEGQTGSIRCSAWSSREKYGRVISSPPESPRRNEASRRHMCASSDAARCE